MEGGDESTELWDHPKNCILTYLPTRAVVVAKLSEPLFPIPEVHGLNPVIGKI